MRPRLALALALTALASSSAPAADAEFAIANAGLSRTIAVREGLLTTIKLEADGVPILASPSLEFMIDINHKGQNTTLIPSDFFIRSTDSITVGQETRMTLEMHSLREGLPIVVRITYYYLPKAAYQQKSITVRPCSKLPGAVLKCIVLEDMELAKQFISVAPIDRFAGPPDAAKPDLTDTKSRFLFGGASDFAAVDPKANRGVFCFVAAPSGTESIGRYNRMILSETMNVPLEKGYETGRATIGAVAGPPEVVFKRFREFLWENYCIARSKPEPGGQTPARVDTPAGSRFEDVVAACEKARKDGGNPVVWLPFETASPARLVHLLNTVDRISFVSGQVGVRLKSRQVRWNYGYVLPPRAIGADGFEPEPAELVRRFGQYFDVYQHVLDFPDGKHIDGEAHIIANKGFILLFNPATEAQKVSLPLDEPGLELKGALTLTDWTRPDSPADIGKAEPGGKVEIEIGPASARIIAVNISS